MITASAPGKLLLFGDHAVVHGYPCISTAVNQRIFVSITKTTKDELNINAPDLKTNYSKPLSELGNTPPKSVAFIEKCYKRFLEKYPQSHGIHVTTQSDFSSLFGFGSSSAVTVAFAKAACELYSISLSEKELFDLCFTAVIDVQGVGSGFDIATAIWGGTIYYVSPATIVKQLNIQSLPIIVGYTGTKADTPTLINKVGAALKKNPKKTTSLFERSGQIVDQAVIALEQNNWEKAGQLMIQNQEILRDLQVSSEKLEQLISATIDAGACGAKLSGAGGGDCMIALFKENEDAIQQAIMKAKGIHLPVQLHDQGVRIEKK